MKGVLLGELIVDQETVGPLWDEMIRYHIHKNLLMELIMIKLTSLHCIFLSSILILSFNRYYCDPGVILWFITPMLSTFHAYSTSTDLNICMWTQPSQKATPDWNQYIN